MNAATSVSEVAARNLFTVLSSDHVRKMRQWQNFHRSSCVWPTRKTAQPERWSHGMFSTCSCFRLSPRSGWWLIQPLLLLSANRMALCLTPVGRGTPGELECVGERGMRRSASKSAIQQRYSEVFVRMETKSFQRNATLLCERCLWTSCRLLAVKWAVKLTIDDRIICCRGNHLTESLRVKYSCKSAAD